MREDVKMHEASQEEGVAEGCSIHGIPHRRQKVPHTAQAKTQANAKTGES
jgi:hypothetical protein